MPTQQFARAHLDLYTEHLVHIPLVTGPSAVILTPSLHQEHQPDFTMGLAYNAYLDSEHIYGCKTCKTHLADKDDIISRVSVLRRGGGVFALCTRF
jgi:hypothetical protein